MMGMVQNDVNVVKRLTKECDLDVRPDLFSDPLPRPWHSRVPTEIKQAWWELDDRTRRLIAMIANGVTS